MGGGTVTPTEPLYGLPGAEDTVEVSVDGDVAGDAQDGGAGTGRDGGLGKTCRGNIGMTIMHVTACSDAIILSLVSTIILYRKHGCAHIIQLPTANSSMVSLKSRLTRNRIMISIPASLCVCVTVGFSVCYSEWKSYLAAQYAAGTPVTIVYELAAPETEALTAISPIAPQPGQLNLATDADALTATIHGSGWETVNDTSSIQDALANLDGDLCLAHQRSGPAERRGRQHRAADHFPGRRSKTSSLNRPNIRRWRIPSR